MSFPLVWMFKKLSWGGGENRYPPLFEEMIRHHIN